MLKKIYLSSPRCVQNLSLTLYGAKSYRDRFEGKLPAEYDVDLSPFLTVDEGMLEAQQRRLSSLVAHCAEYVPFYKKVLKGVNLKEIRVDNLSEYFPVLTKNLILSDPEAFQSTHPSYKKSIYLHTSGSTGTPLTIKSSFEARRLNYKFYNAALEHMGSSYRSKSTTLAGRILYSNPKSGVARYDYFNKTQYMSSYDISDDTIGRYINELNYWKPEFIDSYPSSLESIARLAKKNGYDLSSHPKFLLTSSETLTQNTRKLIEEFFAAPVIDHYGCTEMAVSAFSEGDEYCNNPMYSINELACIEDPVYSLRVTGLLNFAMPLIRYEVGDCVRVNDKENPYRFDSVEGRLDDLIVTVQGRRIGRMDPAFKGIEGVELAQIIQEGLEEIVVLIVLSEEKGERFNSDYLIKNIKERTDRNMSVTLKYVNDIPKSANGKVKSVISKVK